MRLPISPRYHNSPRASGRKRLFPRLWFLIAPCRFRSCTHAREESRRSHRTGKLRKPLTNGRGFSRMVARRARIWGCCDNTGQNGSLTGTIGVGFFVKRRICRSRRTSLCLTGVFAKRNTLREYVCGVVRFVFPIPTREVIDEAGWAFQSAPRRIEKRGEPS